MILHGYYEAYDAYNNLVRPNDWVVYASNNTLIRGQIAEVKKKNDEIILIVMVGEFPNAVPAKRCAKVDRVEYAASFRPRRRHLH